MATLKGMLKEFDGYKTGFKALKKTMDLTDMYTNAEKRMKTLNNTTDGQIELQKKLFAASNRSRSSYADMVNAVAKLNLLNKGNFQSNDEAIGFTELMQKSLKSSGAGKAQQDSTFSDIIQAMSVGKMNGDDFRSVRENAPMVSAAIAMYLGKTEDQVSDIASKGGIAADIVKRAVFMVADNINSKFNDTSMTFSDGCERLKSVGIDVFGGIYKSLENAMKSESGQNAIINMIGALYLAGSVMKGFINFAAAAWPIITPLIWAAVVAIGAYKAAQMIANAQTLIASALSVISTVKVGAQAVAYGVLASLMWATSKATWKAITAEFALNSAIYACPIVWIIGLIAVLIGIFYAVVAAINHFAGTSISATGLIGAAFVILFAIIYDGFIFPFLSAFAMIGNYIGNVFNNPVGAVNVLFLDMANTCISHILNMAKAIENIISKISGVNIDMTSDLEGLKSGIEKKTKEIKDKTEWKEYIKQPKLMDLSGGAAKGYNKASGFADKLSTAFSGFAPDSNFGAGLGLDLGESPDLGLGESPDLGLGGSPNLGSKGFSNFGLGEIPNLDSVGYSNFSQDTFSNLGSSPAMDLSQFATAGNPASVKGTGGSGAVKVENEEDTEWMRKLAERDYVARISQNTLAPSIKIEFSGPITKEADVDGIASHLGNILKEQIAIAPEGVYA